LGGRVREGSLFARGIDDRLQHAFAVLQHTGVPESKDAVAIRSKPSVTFSAALRFSVLAAVDFSHEPVPMTGKVDNE
jgi:hypothetical protein